jgi:hypothetical protein
VVRFLVRAPLLRPLMDGDQSPLGEVAISQDGNEWAVLDIDGTPEEAVAKLAAAQRQGRVAAFQPENTFHALGTVTPTDDNWMGRDFPICGVTPEWQAAVDGGAEVVLAIADTGAPPQAARDAHFSDVEIINVYGGQDAHGHSTFCISRMVGPRGVLPRCRKVICAQALPNGQGTTTTVVQAIRAAAAARPHVLSLSLGGPRDPVIDREIQDAQAHGVPCSAAMGNDGWNARAGSPVAVCRYGWGATTFDGTAPAVFSQGGCNLPEETGALPGQDVGGAHLDGGYGRGSGTSFSCPVGSAIVGAARKKGWAP